MSGAKAETKLMRPADVKQTSAERAVPPSTRRLGLPSSPPAVLLTVYTLIAFMPLALAYMQDLPRRSFSDELSSALAMVAFAMLLMEFVLSGRFESVSGSTGIDLTMRFHQLTARSLTAFILIHPFLYVTPLKHPLPWDTTGQFALGLSSASLMTGLLGWVLLATLGLFAIFRDQLPFHYETWRLSHGLGAALIAAMGTHHAIDAGRYSGWAPAPHSILAWHALSGCIYAVVRLCHHAATATTLSLPSRVGEKGRAQDLGMQDYAEIGCGH